MILVFDFDGTLHRTDRIYGYALRKVLQELRDAIAASGIPEWVTSPEKLPISIPPEKIATSDEELSRYLGVSADAMWEEFFPDIQGELRKTVIRRVGQYMEEGIRCGRSCLYEGIPELLDGLKNDGHTLLILSNCTNSYMTAQRTGFRLDQWFDGYYCSEAYDNWPKECIFEELKNQYPGSYIMIGDRASDMKVGQVHGVKTVGCAYGYGSEGELAAADQIAEDAGELLEILQRLIES